jgi:hypothetical protein
MQAYHYKFTTLDDLALRLCLTKDKEDAQELLTKWDHVVEMDTMSFGVMRLVPLIMDVLARYGLTSLHQKRLKVIYKYWWVAYQHRVYQLRSTMELLAQNQIPAICIKGITLSCHYPKPMLRGMADSDILVPQKLHKKALVLLCQNGWRWEFPDSKKGYAVRRALMLDYEHGVQLIHNSTGSKLDLHSRIGNHSSNKVTQLVWEKSQSIQGRDGLITAELPLYMQLYLVATHAVMSNYTDNLNWIIDINYIMQKFTPREWEQTLELAKNEKTLDELVSVINYASRYISVPRDYLPTNIRAFKQIPGSQNFARWSRQWTKYVILGNYHISVKRRPQSIAILHVAYTVYHLAIKLLSKVLSH